MPKRFALFALIVCTIFAADSMSEASARQGRGSDGDARERDIDDRRHGRHGRRGGYDRGNDGLYERGSKGKKSQGNGKYGWRNSRDYLDRF